MYRHSISSVRVLFKVGVPSWALVCMKETQTFRDYCPFIGETWRRRAIGVCNVAHRARCELVQTKLLNKSSGTTDLEKKRKEKKKKLKSAFMPLSCRALLHGPLSMNSGKGLREIWPRHFPLHVLSYLLRRTCRYSQWWHQWHTVPKSRVASGRVLLAYGSTKGPDSLIVVTADRLAKLVECRTIVREVVGSNPDRTNTQGL